MRHINLIVFTICMFELVHNTTGQIDEQCQVDCACCKNRKCEPGQWASNECTLGCIDGHRGFRCYEICTHNCTKCVNHFDTCTACYDGYYPGPAGDCTSRCLPGCKTCTSGTRCTSCQEGYYDTGNLCNSLCPGNCVMCSSNRECGSCKDGYYNGHQNDNINFPLLNDCTYKCRDNCVRCSSYDRCSVCKTGFYGPNCEKSCSTGCKSNTCDIKTGNCACFPYFAGVRCDKCIIGKYGKMCDQQCPAGCKSNMCERNSGNCTDGCTVVTIIGDKCDVCSTGWYGQYCNISCSFGCKNQQCEKSNGQCSNGCLDNFVGGQCNQCMPDSSSSEQSVNTTAILLGTSLALSVICNIIFVVTFILWKCRKRADDNSKTKRSLYEKSGIELEFGNSANVGNVSNQRLDQASNSDTVFKSHDYEDLGSAQVSEHEYGQIRPDTGLH